MRKREIQTSAHELDKTLDRLISLAQQMQICIGLMDAGPLGGRPQKVNIKKVSVYAAKWPAEFDRNIAELTAQRAKVAAFVRLD